MLELDSHFGQNIAHNLFIIVLCQVEQLRPRQNVIEVILQKTSLVQFFLAAISSIIFEKDITRAPDGYLLVHSKPSSQ